MRGPAPVIAYKVDAWLLGGDGGARWAEVRNNLPTTRLPLNDSLQPDASDSCHIVFAHFAYQLGITPINAIDAFNLRPGGEYKFRVTPRNRYGWGESVTTSNSFTVGEVVDLPEFIKILPGQSKALEGSTIKLECEVGLLSTNIKYLLYHIRSLLSFDRYRSLYKYFRFVEIQI